MTHRQEREEGRGAAGRRRRRAEEQQEGRRGKRAEEPRREEERGGPRSLGERRAGIPLGQVGCPHSSPVCPPSTP